MTREIKFRAWLPEKHWAIGKCARMVEDYAGTILFESLGFFSEDVVYLQYTGFKDKLGTEIYEGDIVRFLYKNPNDHLAKLEPVECEVVWNPAGLWSLKWKDGTINGAPLNPSKYEIVGNAYEGITQ